MNAIEANKQTQTKYNQCYTVHNNLTMETHAKYREINKTKTQAHA